MIENAELISYSGVATMFALGMRHGLDPDHIAVIDGLTLQAIGERPRIAPWVGTLFSLGHGLIVTLIAALVAAMSQQWALPESFSRIGGWIPIALLMLVGVLNLRPLMHNADYRPVGWRSWILPRRLRQSSYPPVIFLIGVLFALVFDTATQAAAWGYVAAAQGGLSLALLLGATFTAGMVVTDTLDSRVVATLAQRARGQQMQQFRRVLGWAIVLMSFGMAAYGIGTKLSPALELSDDAYFYLGASLFVAFAGAYFWAVRQVRSTM